METYRGIKKDGLIGRLISEGATSLDDKELYRCLSGCIAASRCLEAAKHYRDNDPTFLGEVINHEKT